MQVMIITNATRESEAAVPPKPELIAAIGKLAEEGYKAGKIVANGGLLPTSKGTRLALSGGKITATDGPFPETKELVGGFAILKVDSKEEAVEMAKGFLEVHNQIMGPSFHMSCEVRPMFDMGADCGPSKP